MGHPYGCGGVGEERETTGSLAFLGMTARKAKAKANTEILRCAQDDDSYSGYNSIRSQLYSEDNSLRVTTVFSGGVKSKVCRAVLSFRVVRM